MFFSCLVCKLLAMKAVHTEIPYFNPADILEALACQPGLVFLDSANHDQPFEDTNRYSYLGFAPKKTFHLKDGVLNGQAISGSPLAALRDELNRFDQQPDPDLPPFQGGLMGCFSYDLCHYFEAIPRCEPDELCFPDMVVGIYDVVIAFDHQQQRCWVVSTGYPCLDLHARAQEAERRLQQVVATIEQLQVAVAAGPREVFSPQALMADVTRESYEKTVSRCIDYILDGDIFEVNLSQRFRGKLEQPSDSISLYLQLREANPAPFAGYLSFDDFCIASASPERFLWVKQGEVCSRPIKGTIARSLDPEQDRVNQQTLRQSEKDRSENVMVVDLMRNDLSRVCEPDSVIVEKLCGLETYASVHHLVSVVKGKLSAGQDCLGLLEASFPGGSITGAPKIRSMEIISELESCPRGPYCGSLGYIGFSGDMDTSIVIRSFALMGCDITLQAGGAVVLGSDPATEYEETLLKAARCRQVLEEG